MNTSTGCRSRTRPNTRKSQPHGQNQPAQHFSARAVSWHPIMPTRASLPTCTEWSHPSTPVPQLPQASPDPSAATVAPATKVCPHLNLTHVAFACLPKNRPESENQPLPSEDTALQADWSGSRRHQNNLSSYYILDFTISVSPCLPTPN